MRILGLIIAYLAAKNSIQKKPDRMAEDISFIRIALNISR